MSIFEEALATTGRPRDECIPLIRNMLADAASHFRDEETIFRSAGYPQAEEHAKCHTDLMERATLLAEKYERNEPTLGDLFNFIADDIVARHIFTEDKKFFPNIIESEPQSS